MNALVEAIRGGRLKDAVALIAGGADVNEPAFGDTPLMHAVRHAKPEFVELLIINGADWRKRSRDYPKHTPLMQATVNSHVSPWKYFSARQVKASRRIVQILVAAGATDPDTQFVMGNVLNESELVESIHRLRPRGDAKVVEAGAVILEPGPPRTRSKVEHMMYDALLTIEGLAKRRGLSLVLKALLEVNPKEKVKVDAKDAKASPTRRSGSRRGRGRPGQKT